MPELNSKTLINLAQDCFDKAVRKWKMSGSVTQRCCRLYQKAIAYLKVAVISGSNEPYGIYKTFADSDFGKAYKIQEVK